MTSFCLTGMALWNYAEYPRIPMAPIEQRVTSVEGAAQLLGVGRTTAYELVANGSLRSFKVGARRLVPLTAIDEFVERESHWDVEREKKYEEAK